MSPTLAHSPGMEKGQTCSTRAGSIDTQETFERRTTQKPVFKKRLFLLLLFIYLAVINIVNFRRTGTPKQSNTTEFNWDDLRPSETLHWTKCYLVFYCARLTVPLDYSEVHGEKAAVALLKLPSKYSASDKSYRGPILFNPGGPGGSGVDLVLRLGDKFQAVIGDEFDYVGFDPRGVGFTTPHLNIFRTPQEAGLFKLRQSLNSTSGALGDYLALSSIFGDMALARSKKYAEHVSTPTVARDMLSIVRAHGMERIQYWGFSYGTVLGATFAAMFPENVGRLVIDGVDDAENYYATLWDNNLLDTDAELKGFYEECVKVGPYACPIYGSSAKMIHERVTNLMERLRTQPMAFYNQSSGEHGVVDYDVVKGGLFLTLYNPTKNGLEFAKALASLESGNAEPMWQMSIKAKNRKLFECECSSGGVRPYDGEFVIAAIACGDGTPVEDTHDELKTHLENMSKQSIFADVWPVRALCAGWKVTGKDQFKGTIEANTSRPVLLIGNTADPVTPLAHAHKTSKGLNGSVVLTQNSLGHCSLSSVSVCTAKIVREYFHSGELPPEGTICEVDDSIFGGDQKLDSFAQTLGGEDLKRLNALRAIQRDFYIPHFS